MLMDLVKTTDPSTVTQHGLYIRDLGSDSMDERLRKTTKLSQAELQARGQKQTASSHTSDRQQQHGTDGEQPDRGQLPTVGNAGQRLDGQQATAKGSNEQVADGQTAAGVWGKGRVTLLGDAAHANVPNGEILSLHDQLLQAQLLTSRRPLSYELLNACHAGPSALWLQMLHR